jgi:S1-C subfamily serine protease
MDAHPDPFATPPPPARAPVRVMAVMLLGLIVVNLALLVWLTLRGSAPLPAIVHPHLPKLELAVSAPALEPLPAELGADEQRTIELFRRAAPSVVFVTNLAVRRDAFSRNALETPRGTGSGFVWDDEGHIVTNFHVIRGGNAARVTFDDQKSYPAKLVGTAPDKDIAVLRIEAPNGTLRPLPRGSSASLHVGQMALAIGNPFGLDHTLSTGVVSGLEREIESLAGRPIFGVIQTDAAINPGNSGGPLLDSSGRLIGINTAIFSPSGASAGIGFAVPVDTVERIVPQLIEHGRVMRPGLGVSFDPNLQRRSKIEGIIVLGVQPGSAAAEAGLKPAQRDPSTGDILLGDVIVAIDDTAVKDEKDLFKLLDVREVGDKLKVTVKRGKERRDLDVVLKAIEES